MIRAPQSERRRRPDDADRVRRRSLNTPVQVHGSIKRNAFPRGVVVAAILRMIPGHASPNDGAAL